MARYALRRIVEAIPVFLGVVLVVFLLYSVVPGDPARLLAGQRGDPETIARIRAMVSGSPRCPARRRAGSPGTTL